MRFAATLDKAMVKCPKASGVCVALTITAPASSAMMDLIRLSTGGSVEVDMKVLQSTLAFEDKPTDEHPPAPDPDEDDDDDDEDDDPDGDIDEDDEIDDERKPLEVVHQIQP